MTGNVKKTSGGHLSGIKSSALGRCGAYKLYTNDTAEDTIQA